MSLEELWFQSSNMNTQRSGGGEGGGGRWKSEKRKERTERKCLLIKQREDGEQHETNVLFREVYLNLPFSKRNLFTPFIRWILPFYSDKSFQSLHKGQSVYIQDDFQAAVHRDIKNKFYIRRVKIFLVRCVWVISLLATFQCWTFSTKAP